MVDAKYKNQGRREDILLSKVSGPDVLIEFKNNLALHDPCYKDFRSFFFFLSLSCETLQHGGGVDQDETVWADSV